MEPLAVIRRMTVRQRSPRVASAWVKIDGRWHRCATRSLGIERDFVEWNDNGWRRCSPLPALRVTLRATLADGSSIALEAYPASVKHTATGYRVSARGVEGRWRRLDDAYAGAAT